MTSLLRHIVLSPTLTLTNPGCECAVPFADVAAPSARVARRPTRSGLMADNQTGRRPRLANLKLKELSNLFLK